MVEQLLQEGRQALRDIETSMMYARG